MDRRQRKTREAIFRAFRTLLERKRYDHITVRDILEEADIGRSTFYAHFETKDMLLKAMCGEIFNHVFENDPCPWVGRDADLQGKLAHILWHIRDGKRDLVGVLRSDSSELFMTYFKEQLYTTFERYIADFKSPVPRDYLLHHLVSGFAETVKWWIAGDMVTTPEETARYFLAVTETH